MDKNSKILLLFKLSNGDINLTEFNQKVKAEQEIQETYCLPQTFETNIIKLEHEHQDIFEQIMKGEFEMIDEKLLFEIANCFQNQIGQSQCISTFKDMTDKACLNCKTIKNKSK